MTEELYFIKITQPFSSGLVQRQSTSSSILLTHNLSRAKFFEARTLAEKYVEKINQKCYKNNEKVNFYILKGYLEV